MNDFAAFARLIQAVEPWRAHLVIVGGWAHRLFRFHPMASVPSYQPLLTRDTDLAFANRAPLVGDIKSSLVTAGFQEEVVGDFHPPATHYTLGDDDAGFYAEFLTPLQGSGIRRSGAPDATVSKAGITAQKLRYLDALLVKPWLVRIGPEQGIPLPKASDLQIPNPMSFIAQKLLIQHERRPDKRAQDILYVHDTIELFGGVLPQLKSLWENDIRPTLSTKASRRVIDASRECFSSANDVIRDAARIPQDRTLSPERMRAACHLALAEVLA